MDILIAIALLGGLSLAFGLILAFASKVFYVKTDPRLEQLNDCLPCANCGGCGYAGCSSYAEAILKGETTIDKCAAGGNETAKNVAAIMGMEAVNVERKVALVRCSGEHSYDAEGNLISGSKTKAAYEGLNDCAAAARVAGYGPLACEYGCLGFGTCVKACRYGAISVQNGVAVGNEELCIGCMACAGVCPRGLIIPVDPGRNVVIACHSLAKGAAVTKSCTVGCIGCGLCSRNCPNGAITITDNLAVIDYSKCDNCGKCAAVCPKKLIKDSNVEHLPDLGEIPTLTNPNVGK